MSPHRIARMGASGDGVAEDGTFLPFTLPGEVVEGAAAGEGRAAPVRWERESPDRVEPPCPRFGRCGGCALQHWRGEAYAAWKRGLLVEALERAGFSGEAVGALRQSPPRSRRRADLGARRMPDGAVALGFHARLSRDLVDISPCLILRPELMEVLPRLAEVLRGLQGLRREGAAVLNLLDTGPDLLLRTDGPLGAQDRARLGALGFRRVAWALKDGAPETAFQSSAPEIAFGGARVTPPPGAFLQATADGERAIVELVLAGLPARLPRGSVVADLYAGAGTLSFPLAARAPIVRAVEGAPDAVASLDAASRRHAQGRVKAERRDLANRPLLARELEGLAAAVLDPPFAGAAAQVEQIAKTRKLGTVIYVSCNPAALARDLRALRAAGFAVASATPVDQFLWSAHLESVVVLRRD